MSRFPTPETLRIVCASLGIDRNGLQQLFNVDSRTAQRWIATRPANPRIQDQIAAWQSSVSAELEAVLSEVDEQWSDGKVVRLVRYPDVDFMPPADARSIWWHSPATYDAFVSRLAATLFDQKVPFVVETATSPQPHVRIEPAG